MSLKGSEAFGGRNVHYEKDGEARVTIECDVHHGVVDAYNKMHAGFRV